MFYTLFFIEKQIDEHIGGGVTHSARVVHSTSHLDVTLRERPSLCPYVSFPDVLYVPASVERNLYV